MSDRSKEHRAARGTRTRRARSVGAAVLLAVPVAAQVSFTRLPAEFPLPVDDSAYNRSLGDYDNDGRLDALFAWERRALLHNEGGGRFREQRAWIDADFHGRPGDRPRAAGLFADYDNDGDLDIFLPVESLQDLARLTPPLLLRNDEGSFVDVAAQAGLGDLVNTNGAVWLDYDLDGLLDLYVATSTEVSGRNRLYRNKGDGTFEETTQQAGLDVPLSAGGASSYMVSGDFDDDGRPDLYVAGGEATNRLFLNDGDGRFREAPTPVPSETSLRRLSPAVGDVDNDGRLDLFQPQFSNQTFGVLERSPLLLNLGAGQFLDVTEGVGLQALTSWQVFDAHLVDMDNDGHLDLLSLRLPRRLFLNNGDGTFVDRSSTVQQMLDPVAEEKNSEQRDYGRHLLDLDGDGFQDVVNVSYGLRALHRHDGNGHHWLRVELVGTASNRNGIGARLLATAGELRQARQIHGGRGEVQEELAAHFGLGPHDRVDQLVIRWPSGHADTLADVPADRRIRVIEGRPAYHTVEPTTWESLPPDTLKVGATTAFTAAVRPALFEPGARITGVTTDLSRLGGPSQAQFLDDGNGIWRLRTSFVAAGRHGFDDVSVLIRQSASLGPYWVRLSRPILLAAGEDLPVWTDGPAPGWRLEPGRGLDLDPAAAGEVAQGRTALELRPQRSWRVDLVPDVPLIVAGYSALRFAFHPGDARGTSLSVIAYKPQELVRRFDDSAFLETVDLLDGRVSLESQQWQTVEIPLEAFQIPWRSFDLETPIAGIRLAGNLQGTFHVDDVRLVAVLGQPSTAVLEEHADALPRTSELMQNAPNPFNGGTVIRYALPGPSRVRLTVFNLTGQRVASLVDGERPAGTHTVRWDGRDAGGGALASGVYLYRLRTGDRETTRRMLLLR